MSRQIKKAGNELNESIRLKDGRRLGYKEYGAKEGFPILALHGTPGSRIWFTEDDPTCLSLGIRLITVDRPGYGLSDKKSNRTIIDFNEDLDQLINQLGLNRFSIFGVSGGGAYTLAFATKNHSNIHKVGIVASAYEFINGKTPAEMCRPNRIAFYLAKRIPWILRFNYKQQKKLLYEKPDLYRKSIRKHVSHLCPSDQEVLKQTETAESMTLHFREAFRSSAIEAVYEMQLLGKNWELELSKIETQIEVWHGEADTLSPLAGLKKFVKDIPNYNTHFLKGKGHFLDEDIDVWQKILKSLL